MTRQQRRLFERQFRKLIRTAGDNCSLCDAEFQHNSSTFGGCDQDGNIALTGECCVARLHTVYTAGVVSHRNYDFLVAGKNVKGLGPKQIMHAVSTCQRAIAGADEQVKEDLWQRGGVKMSPNSLISVLNHPWKTDDRLWFEQHPERSHRARFPFPGEVEPQHADAPEGHRLLLLLRQVEPGKRIKVGFFIATQALPVPDAEAVAHALFDIATEREPMLRNREAITR